MNGSIPVVFEEGWDTYSFGTDEGPVFVTFYTEAGEIPRDQFPFCARVIIPINQPNENGGPDEEEAETLWNLEDTLTEMLTEHQAKCVMLARLTHTGFRELVFQVADWDSFRAPVGLWMQQTPDYDTDVSEHDDWEFFDECVWPSDEDWIMIFDQRVVDNLIESGSDPKKEHCLDFAFAGEQDALQQLKQTLAERGYTPEDSAEEPADQLVMVKKTVLDMHLIWHESLENNRLCEELGVECLGWGVAIVK